MVGWSIGGRYDVSVYLQILAIVIVIGIGKIIGLVEFPNPSIAQFQKVKTYLLINHRT